ncbi:MAG: PQQ-binding-like beta-propeller repeat protein [Planctomycetota bacterium]|nr:PQQ-binding-like beta-propeller repeat protein [Planctomycetota bacterium]
MKNCFKLNWLLGISLLAVTCDGDDWPQFLGPNRNSKSAEAKLLNQWPQDGLDVQWRVKLGEGMSGISIVGTRLVTMYQDDKNQFVACLRTTNGEKLWETPVASRYENSMGHGPRATPTIVDNHVYSYSGDGILTALDLETGNVIWSSDPKQKLKSKPAEYGLSSSPLVLGNEVIIQTQPGDEGYSICAYARDNGKFKWGTLRYPPGYSSPVIFEHKNSPQILLFSGEALVGVEPVTGRAIWEFPFITEYNCNVANPIVIGKDILISSGENQGSVLLSVTAKTANGNTNYKVKPVWSSRGRNSLLRSEWQTPIYHDGYLYGFDNVGSAGPVTSLTCLNLETGKQNWLEKRFGKGNLIFADNKLLITTMKGHLILVKANPHKFEELGRQVVIGQTRQPPALSNGRVYLRDNREVVCIDLNR